MENHSNCIHSRQVQALVDGNLKGKFLSEHVTNCTTCLNKYETIKNEEEVIAMAIPFQQVPDDVKDSLQLDLAGITESLDRYVKDIKGRNRKKILGFMAGLSKDLSHSILKPIPLTSLAFIAATILLKIYF